jgi:hypothetical protein
MIRAVSTKEIAISFFFLSTSLLLWDFALFRLLDANQAPRIERIGQLIQVVRSIAQVLHGVVNLVVVGITCMSVSNALACCKVVYNSVRSLRSGSRASVTVPFTF